MAKIIITIEDTADGEAAVSAEVFKEEHLEGQGTTYAEELAYSFFETVKEAADQVISEGEIIKDASKGGNFGKH